MMTVVMVYSFFLLSQPSEYESACWEIEVVLLGLLVDVTRTLHLFCRTSTMRGTDWKAQKKNSKIGYCRNYEGKIDIR